MFAKTFYYNFFPTKAEEEAYALTNSPHIITKTLTEIRDVYEPKPIESNPWVIKKVLTPAEAGAGKIVLQFIDTFNHIFRHWSMEMVNRVVKGNRQNVVVWDATDESNPTSYISEDMFLETGPEHEYFLLGCMDLIRDRRLIAGDEIGMFWEIKTASFQLRIFHGGV